MGTPDRAAVVANDLGSPKKINGDEVEFVRESWWIEDAWWSKPIRRAYWEVVTESGRLCVVFHDELKKEWYEQAGG